MKVKSMRIPEDIDQAIDYVSKLEKIEKAQSLRKLARLGFEYYVAKNYREGRITLRNTSDLLNLNLSETVDLLLEMGVKGNIRASDVYASLNSIAPLDKTNV
jgi:predicted HTH domain antitoxin